MCVFIFNVCVVCIGLVAKLKLLFYGLHSQKHVIRSFYNLQLF